MYTDRKINKKSFTKRFQRWLSQTMVDFCHNCTVHCHAWGNTPRRKSIRVSLLTKSIHMSRKLFLPKTRKRKKLVVTCTATCSTLCLSILATSEIKGEINKCSSNNKLTWYNYEHSNLCLHWVGRNLAVQFRRLYVYMKIK